MDKPLVSWLMPVYNGEKYIRRAMDSMLNQTYTHYEIILVLDGCTDNSLNISEEYAREHPNIRIVINDSTLGIAASLSRGLDLCKGKYIARMDVDDFSHPERLDKQVAYMEANPNISVLGSRVILKSETGTRISTHLTDIEAVRASLLFSTSMMHSTVMLRVEIFLENNWKYPDNFIEDYALWASIITKADIANLPEPLLDYYVHGENISFSRFSKTRSSTAKTSKETIKNELGVETAIYPDAYFGWTGSDPVPCNVTKFLLEGAELLNNIQNANYKLKKFDKQALYAILQRQWKIIKRTARMSTIALGFDADTSLLSSAVERFISLQNAKPRVIIYGIGQYCTKFFNKPNSSDFIDILAFCDTDIKKHGTSFFDKPIISPQEISGLEYDYILIASPIYQDEIKNMLVQKLGVAEKQIFYLPPFDEMGFFQRRDKYEKSYAHIGQETKAYLFVAPDYGNLGDHAIAEAVARFFRNNFGVEPAETPCMKFNEAIMIANKHIRPSDLILITGGGFLGSLWFYGEEQARKVISTYKDNPIVILPQTLFWEDTSRWQKELEETQRAYASHPNLTFCARDKKTYTLVKELYPSCRVVLVPDMVLASDWSDWLGEYSSSRLGAMLCLKGDKESILSENDNTLLTDIGKELCGTVIESNTELYCSISMEHRREMLVAKLQEFQSAELVITDRLHGLIFAAVTETPCVALNNVNHKLRETFDWVKHLPYLKFADSVSDVENLAKQVLSVKDRRYDASYFEKDFKALLEAIKPLINS